jgi:hypothetical protein
MDMPLQLPQSMQSRTEYSRFTHELGRVSRGVHGAEEASLSKAQQVAKRLTSDGDNLQPTGSSERTLLLMAVSHVMVMRLRELPSLPSTESRHTGFGYSSLASMLRFTATQSIDDAIRSEVYASL